MAVQYYEGIGRRKESTARVRLMSGSGKFVVNDKPAEAYFNRLGDIEAIIAALRRRRRPQSPDITVVVKGGGVTGQTSGAVGRRLGIDQNEPGLPASFARRRFRPVMHRIKERKKPGLKRARKAPTYTKR
jgi:small subunit ribosomal protein S9